MRLSSFFIRKQKRCLKVLLKNFLATFCFALCILFILLDKGQSEEPLCNALDDSNTNRMQTFCNAEQPRSARSDFRLMQLKLSKQKTHKQANTPAENDSLKDLTNGHENFTNPPEKFLHFVYPFLFRLSHFC